MISLIIIPVLTILVVVYISNLIAFSFTNDINIVLTLSSIFGIILLTLILPSGLEKIFKNSYLIYELDNKANILCGYISFLLLFIFGISLIINGTIFEFSIFKIFIGTFIILLFIYINYFILEKKEVVVNVITCDLEDKIYAISLEDEEENLYEIISNKNLEIDKYYKAIVLKNIKTIVKVKEKVIIIE